MVSQVVALDCILRHHSGNLSTAVVNTTVSHLLSLCYSASSGCCTTVESTMLSSQIARHDRKWLRPAGADLLRGVGLLPTLHYGSSPGRVLLLPWIIPYPEVGLSSPIPCGTTQPYFRSALRIRLRLTCCSMLGYFHPSITAAALGVFSCYPVDHPIPCGTTQPYFTSASACMASSIFAWFFKVSIRTKPLGAYITMQIQSR